MTTYEGIEQHVTKTDGDREAEHLRRALQTRTTIAAAVGILMERYDIDYDAAFGHLARLSQERNTKLREIAESVLARTGL